VCLCFLKNICFQVSGLSFQVSCLEACVLGVAENMRIHFTRSREGREQIHDEFSSARKFPEKPRLVHPEFLPRIPPILTDEGIFRR